MICVMQQGGAGGERLAGVVDGYGRKEVWRVSNNDAGEGGEDGGITWVAIGVAKGRTSSKGDKLEEEGSSSSWWPGEEGGQWRE